MTDSCSRPCIHSPASSSSVTLIAARVLPPVRQSLRDPRPLHPLPLVTDGLHSTIRSCPRFATVLSVAAASVARFRRRQSRPVDIAVSGCPISDTRARKRSRTAAAPRDISGPRFPRLIGAQLPERRPTRIGRTHL